MEHKRRHISARENHSARVREKMPKKRTTLAKLSKPRLHKAVSRGQRHGIPPRSCNHGYELPYLRVFRIIAGTGEYKAIRGGGRYEGIVTERGKAKTLHCSAEY